MTIAGVMYSQQTPSRPSTDFDDDISSVTLLIVLGQTLMDAIQWHCLCIAFVTALHNTPMITTVS